MSAPVDLDALAKAWETKAQKRAPTILWDTGWGGAYGEPPPAPVTATPLHYVQSEAVNAAVNAFANRVSSTRLQLFEEQSNGELEEKKAWPRKQRSPQQVLDNPNPFLTRTELFWHLTADWLLNGNSLWFLAGPKRGAPSEIWRLNPRHTRLVRSKQDYIAGYITEIDGKMIPLDPGEVIHFKRPNPFDEFYGLGQLATAALAAQTSRDMATWNRNMFAKDYAVPAGLVSVQQVTDSDFDRMKTEWRQSYGGGSRRTAFARGSGIQFQPIGLSQTDVDFLQGARWEAEKIYRVFGTYHLLPAQYADDRKVNERQFLEEHAWPMLVYIAEVLTDKLLTFWGPAEGSGRLVAQFDDIRPRERSLELEEQREEDKGRFFNEWRQSRGMEPKEGWDDILFLNAVDRGEKPVEEEPEPTPPQTDPQPTAVVEDDEPPDANKPQDAQENAEERESAGDDVGDDKGDRFDKAADPDAIHRELSAWQKFTLRRLGDEEARPFEPDVTPDLLTRIIQRRLDTSDTAEAVKVVFEAAHDLADGRLPDVQAKASFGTPSGTVVLYVADREDLLTTQQVLQRTFPSDAPIRWTPVEHLHITLVHSPLVDEPDFRNIFQETGGGFTTGMTVTATRLSTFDANGGPIPVVALVEPPEDLKLFQLELYTSFDIRGIAVSEYSNPEAWQPHITLGYIDATYAGDLNMDMPLEITCRLDVLSFTRGDYENIYSRVAALIEVSTPELEPEEEPASEYLWPEESMKAIQATRLEFEADFEQLLNAAREGNVERRQWGGRMRTLLQKYGEAAYRDGLNDGGVAIDPDEPLSDEDRAEVNIMLAEQSQYVTEFGAVLFDKKAITDAEANNKPILWWNRSIMPFYNQGRLSADKNGMYEWVLGNTEEHCTDCLRLSGQRHRYRDWATKDLIPPTGITECGGWHCDCKLAKTTERARGRF